MPASPIDGLGLLREIWLGRRTGLLRARVPGRMDLEVEVVRGCLVRGTDLLKLRAAVLNGSLHYHLGLASRDPDPGGTLRFLLACAAELAPHLPEAIDDRSWIRPTAAGRAAVSDVSPSLAAVLKARSCPITHALAVDGVERAHLRALAYFGLVQATPPGDDPARVAPLVIEERAASSFERRNHATVELTEAGETRDLPTEEEARPPRRALTPQERRRAQRELLSLAREQQLRGEAVQAVRTIEHCLELDPEEPQVLARLAQALVLADRTSSANLDRARQLVRQALQRSEGDQSVAHLCREVTWQLGSALSR